MSVGEPADLDQLRLKIDDPKLAEYLLQLQDLGRMNPDRAGWLERILAVFRERQVKTETRELQDQLHAVGDHAQALDLLRQLQNR